MYEVRKPHGQVIDDIIYSSGSEGTHSFDLMRRVTPRTAARIYDNKKKGIEYVTKPERKGNAVGVRYWRKEFYRGNQ